MLLIEFMIQKNNLISASAGSGKTKYLVDEALKILDQNVLITTYTDANEKEIRNKIINIKWYIPANITIQTRFSFLLQHGVRPYQSVMHDELFDKIVGFFMIEGVSGQYISEKKNFLWYYFKDFKVYSDKISKFVIAVDKETNGEVINRISRIFPNIFIDELQDLAGYDLNFLKLLLESRSKILLVWDPRLWNYSTNYSKKNSQFKRGDIINFFESKAFSSLLKVNHTLLTTNYRCHSKICNFSNKIYPEYPPTVSWNTQNSEHVWIFLVKPKDVEKYCKQYEPVTILKERGAIFPQWNFWMTKGLSFDRVLIFPTKDICLRLKDNSKELAKITRAKFYVAVTRARYSVAFVYDYKPGERIEGIQNYI